MVIFYTFKKLNKKFRFGYIGSSGRNFLGKICVRHLGGGTKKNILSIDFVRRMNLFGYIAKIQKTTFMTGYLGLIIFQNGVSNYVLLSENLKIGERCFFGTTLIKHKERLCLKNGSSVPLAYVPLFSLVNNVELINFKGGQLARAAGTSLMLVSKTVKSVSLKLKSGWNYTLLNHNICTFGLVSNSNHRFTRIKKAGVSRGLGIRPTVRGVAMNPCDHPHGGGEGKKSPLAAPKSPWGWLTKGTASNKKKYEKIKKKLYKKIR